MRPARRWYHRFCSASVGCERSCRRSSRLRVECGGLRIRAIPNPLPCPSPGGRGEHLDCASSDALADSLQHPALHLIALDALEQRLEVALAEPLVALALDDLEEDRADRVLGEDLQQLALLGLGVGVDQDL